MFRRFALTLALVTLAQGGLAQDFLPFQSPTGNIGCAIMLGDPAEVRCDLRAFTPSFAEKPADCDVDWGFAFVVGTSGPGRPICAGDTVMMGDAPVLDYGQSIAAGGFTCLSEPTGMSCTNSQGHGFTIARAAQQVF